jgi:hypothetical protein
VGGLVFLLHLPDFFLLAYKKGSTLVFELLDDFVLNPGLFLGFKLFQLISDGLGFAIALIDGVQLLF